MNTPLRNYIYTALIAAVAWILRRLARVPLEDAAQGAERVTR
jgi:hypothetical protein